MPAQTPLAPFIGERTPRILVVDDEPANVKVLAGHLTRWGCEVQVAYGGTDALSSVTTGSYDLILLDIMMPDRSGYEVCALLQADPATRDIPIIFLTALSQDEAKVKGFEAGARDYITKPFLSAELAARVGARLRQKFKEDELRAHLAQVAGRIATDALTGLLNRSGFEQTVIGLLATAGPSRWPLSLLMMSVDHLGRLRADQGQAQCDRVLRAVADAIRSVGGAADAMARSGVDEFAWILPATNDREAQGIAEAVRQHVATLGATVSVGGTTLANPDGQTAQALLAWLTAAARGALDRVKRAGGDGVSWA